MTELVTSSTNQNLEMSDTAAEGVKLVELLEAKVRRTREEFGKLRQKIAADVTYSR